MDPAQNENHQPLSTMVKLDFDDLKAESISAEDAIKLIIRTSLFRDPSDGVAYRNIARILLYLGYRFKAETCWGGSLMLAIDPEMVELSHVNPKTVHEAIAAGEAVREYPFSIYNPLTKFSASRSFDGRCPEILTERAPKNRNHFVAEFANGRCLIGNVGYAIFSSAGSYIVDFCGNDGRLVGASDPNYHPELTKLSGTAAVLTNAFSNGHFHWMLETLPRLALFQAAGHKLENIDYFITRKLYPYQIDMLRKLGIPDSKLIFSGEHPNVSADKLLVTSNVENFTASQGPTDIEIDSWICSYIANSLRPINIPETDYGKRIYISRQSAGHRKFINGEDVDNVMKENSFNILNFSDLGIEEKYACLSNADIVFAINGAGLAYLPFCKENTKIIIVYPDNYEINTFWAIANYCKLKHYHLICDFEWDYFPYTAREKTRQTQDLLLNIGNLKKTLHMVLSD